MQKKDKKPVVEEKPPLFPEREAPKREELLPEALLQELRSYLAAKKSKYFDDATSARIESSFRVFDRNEDGLISFSEFCELAIANGFSTQAESTLLALFYLQEKQFNGEKGVDLDSAFIMLTKEKRDNDVEAHLLEAFKVFDPKGTGFVPLAQMKESLMYSGYRYSEEQVDEFLRFADKDGLGKIQYKDFAELVSQQNPPKKKKKPVAKK